ncbi:hypothetical protein BUALT_Bualt03G0005300 [Buddleja alternifolia]|uniref:Pectin lyase-like superfamily protein n=1 Tax=Buddleja alternifolia TaxID=168488 RepID=A0AAV6Y0W5_9LAMI|nr:hypothetical protein BUALT_Bualt03G0005300 [Buddleja alternifolia]
MRNFSPALSFLIMFLLLKETRCSFRQLKLYEFQTKLLATAAPSPSSPPTFSNGPKSNGRVLYPIGYGADPTGEQDSTAPILEALNDAGKLQNGLDLLPGISDLGGIVIDLQGGNFRISSPISFKAYKSCLPIYGNSGLKHSYYSRIYFFQQLTNYMDEQPFLKVGKHALMHSRLKSQNPMAGVQGGTLRASNTFPGDRHLIELWAPNSPKAPNTNSATTDNFSDRKDMNNGMQYEDITFRDILFDSTYQGGGLLVIDSARIRIVNCFFLHFTTQGILIERGHETFISNSFLGQHPTVGGDRVERNYTATAIDIASTDNAVTDVAIFSAATGIILRGNANIVTGVHCYNKAASFGGIGILIKSAQNRIVNPYLDFNTIVIEDPSQVHVSNGYFLGDGNIVLKSIQGRISGLNIVDNIFCGNPDKMVPSVKFDGQFTSVDQVVIDHNIVNGMSLKSTVAKLTVAGNGTKWVADFSPILLFPDKINHVQYSFYTKGGVAAGFPAHAVTNVSSNVVVIESQQAAEAMVSVFVDQHNMAGEGNLLM